MEWKAPVTRNSGTPVEVALASGRASLFHEVFHGTTFSRARKSSGALVHSMEERPAQPWGHKGNVWNNGVPGWRNGMEEERNRPWNPRLDTWSKDPLHYVIQFVQRQIDAGGLQPDSQGRAGAYPFLTVAAVYPKFLRGTPLASLPFLSPESSSDIACAYSCKRGNADDPDQTTLAWQVIRTAESVLLICCPPAPAR